MLYAVATSDVVPTPNGFYFVRGYIGRQQGWSKDKGRDEKAIQEWEEKKTVVLQKRSIIKYRGTDQKKEYFLFKI